MLECWKLVERGRQGSKPESGRTLRKVCREKFWQN